ncbi:MAG: glucose-6-phosphate isomerase, partial [Aigarchaeota archaeon]|nr:glucose-6-phosphate isomerase [Candidatus Calditenuaceae archaeon]
MSFSAHIDTVKHLITPYTNHRVVKLSSLKEYFIDQEAAEKILKEKDPVVYEYYEKTFENEEENMNFGLTIIYPGKIGREYFMTRGHFHVKRKPEIYLGLKGEGLILMQSFEGRVEWQPLKP